MALDKSQSQEVDLERTDRLPIFDGEGFDDDEDVEDDPVRMDFAPVVPSVKPEFPRPSAVDLPSLAESVRSVEERIARHNAEFEALSRSYEKTRDAETAAAARASELAADVAAMRALLEAEQSRSRELGRLLAEKDAAANATQSRIEGALREAERYQSEARTLRDTLEARDAIVARVTHSLGERDAQLTALQQEHARVVPALEDRSRAGEQLEADLRAERERASAMAIALQNAQQSVVALTARLRAGAEEIDSTRRELNGVKTQAASHLENLRTREWRRGFEQNLYRELDAKIGAVQDDHGALQSQRDQFRDRVKELESKLAARDEAIAKLQAAAVDDEELRLRHEKKLKQVEQGRTDLMQRITVLDGERTRLSGELAARDARIADLQSAAVDQEAVCVNHEIALRRAEEARAELLLRIGVLEGEHGRLADDVAARDAVIAQLEAAAAAEQSERSEQEQVLQQAEQACAELNEQIAVLSVERSRLNGELGLQDKAIAEARAAGAADAARNRELLAAAQQEHGEMLSQIESLRSEVQEREEAIAALQTQLQDVRGPLEPIEAEVKRLTEDLAARAAAVEQLNEDNRALRSALERARGALEEREFLIRRLERSETNNANVLGRIQTSIERLGSGGAANATHAGSAAAPLECTAELIRVDGQHNTSHVLSRRTRIGRAPGCEMQIESTSVSRHHALVLMSTRDVIIEDLNSTNGVLVNGRKISRHLLHDGDVLTIGDAQFRLSVKFAPRTLESVPAEPQ